MQTILGAGGAIGKDLARELSEYTSAIRLVNRNPEKVNESDELFPADLTQEKAVFEAVKGSEIVYVTVGFPYSTKAWRSLWPPFMRNVIAACQKEDAKLVFFDNIYMYDPDHLGNMTEETPHRPCSKKGEVRKEVVDMIKREVEGGSLTALIARSADFYGPGVTNSVLQNTVQDNFKKGKKAIWLRKIDKIHHFTYTTDAARATAILGNTPDAYQQSWHLPTDNSPLTGKDWIELFAKEMQVKARYQVASHFMLNFIGWFNPIMKEIAEMDYQYDRDYLFISKKFEDRFGLKPTSPEDGVKAVLNLHRE
jgi:nucleoside-diphosphate-sugar epimerase